MTAAWTTPPRHAVQFHDTEQGVSRALAEFFAQGAQAADPCLLVARAMTRAAVIERLASAGYGSLASRLEYVDAEASFPTLMRDGTLDWTGTERFFLKSLIRIRHDNPDRTIRLAGEMVDVLCEHGHASVALELERLANRLFERESRMAMLCCYSASRFQGIPEASLLRAVCQEHTHVVRSGDGAGTAETMSRESALVPRSAGHARVSGNASLAAVYVIDDDESMRRSLGRLLTLSRWPVRTFETAEAFLSELPALAPGFLLIDIQLPGMNGVELLDWLAAQRIGWPAIAMSGSHDENAEGEAVRLGARAFLRKPFEPRVLLNAIEQAASGNS